MTDADDLDYLESLLDEPFKQKNVSKEIYLTIHSFSAKNYFILKKKHECLSNLFKYIKYL